MFRRIPLFLAMFAVSGVAWLGCAKEPFGPVVGEPEQPNYDQELAPGQLALRKITDPNKIPDFSYGFGRRAELAESEGHSGDQTG